MDPEGGMPGRQGGGPVREVMLIIARDFHQPPRLEHSEPGLDFGRVERRVAHGFPPKVVPIFAVEDLIEVSKEGSRNSPLKMVPQSIQLINTSDLLHIIQKLTNT